MKDSIELPIARTVKVRASVFRRIGAVLIDLVFIYSVVSSLVWLIPTTRNLEASIPQNVSFSELQTYYLNNPEIVQWSTIFAIIMSAVLLLYFSIAEFKFGQTIGKNLLDIRVESLKGNVTLGQSMLRSLWVIIVVPTYLLLVVDLAYMFFNKDHQRLLERLSNTKTVQKVNI
jgi:uncharacterized RDD family membrane protein YckC